MTTYDHPKNSSPTFAFMLLAPVASFLLGAALIYWTGIRWQLAANGIFSATCWGLISGIFTYLILAMLARLAIARPLRVIIKKLRHLFRDMKMWQIAALALTAGIGEEVFFRGFMQIWLSDFMAVEFAITITAIFFGLLHFASVSYFLLTTLFGFALGITYQITNSLLLIMVWHASYDLIALWILSRHPDLIGI